MVQQAVFYEADCRKVTHERRLSYHCIFELLLGISNLLAYLVAPIALLLFCWRHIWLLFPWEIKIDPQIIDQFQNLVGCMIFCKICDLEHIFSVTLLFFFDEFYECFEVPSKKQLIIFAPKNYKLVKPVRAEAIDDVHALRIFGPLLMFSEIFEASAGRFDPPRIETFFV